MGPPPEQVGEEDEGPSTLRSPKLAAGSLICLWRQECMSQPHRWLRRPFWAGTPQSHEWGCIMQAGAPLCPTVSLRAPRLEGWGSWDEPGEREGGGSYQDWKTWMAPGLHGVW